VSADVKILTIFALANASSKNVSIDNFTGIV